MAVREAARAGSTSRSDRTPSITSRVSSAPPSGTLYTQAMPAPAPQAASSRRCAVSMRGQPDSRTAGQPGGQGRARQPRRRLPRQGGPHADEHHGQHRGAQAAPQRQVSPVAPQRRTHFRATGPGPPPQQPPTRPGQRPGGGQGHHPAGGTGPLDRGQETPRPVGIGEVRRRVQQDHQGGTHESRQHARGHHQHPQPHRQRRHIHRREQVRLLHRPGLAPCAAAVLSRTHRPPSSTRPTSVSHPRAAPAPPHRRQQHAPSSARRPGPTDTRATPAPHLSMPAFHTLIHGEGRAQDSPAGREAHGIRRPRIARAAGAGRLRAWPAPPGPCTPSASAAPCP